MLRKTADPEDVAKEVSEGVYWLKNWAGGIPGLVNRDVHVVRSYLCILPSV